MKYGIWSNYYQNTPIETVIDRFVDHGFNHSEFSDEHGAMALSSGKDPKIIGQTIKAYGLTKGFSFPQGHLKLDMDIVALDDDMVLTILIPWIDLFAAIGIRKAVLHPGGQYEMDHDVLLSKRVSVLKKLCHYIESNQYDLTICIENLYQDSNEGPLPIMATAQEMNELIDAVGSDHLGVCLDTGHLNIVDGDTITDFIHGCGHRLQALHIADNLGLDDDHMMPYGKGTVNWENTLAALKDIGYSDFFNLEIPGESNAPLVLLGAKLDYLHQVCEYMTQIIEQ